ncbi:unnamed protein product [Rotaria socialis]|uniref:G-protein coupled receptors family 1 profile domain-containing protein n=2 Tax=Rotaria socialis TaxID=392032 RepID=A0A820XIY8_9BILA|nr:unnamed protein product [Rotaria socialis]CAF3651251.1 unnamed protein product [Rotaria socialis]CAF4533908.1 unnamed protein product [Rotaria socialis]CAF4606372.1 unnamed protein product [Rotaria socialis]CAF4922966.1 unnamed protein product [Rotaria socialis]
MNFGMNNTTTADLIHVHIPSLRVLIAFICLALYLFGYTGCILSIVTFSSKKLRQHSTGFLFFVMAFVDIFNLVASLQYFLDAIYQINVYNLSIHWCRFFTIVNYELYFGFSWVLVFISVDRWIKVEWPTKSQTLCTRKRFIHLCLIALFSSLVQNVTYTLLCFNEKCAQKNILCEILIHVIYISIYMVIPIVIILLSISRTCLITMHLKKRFRTKTQQQTNVTSNARLLKVDTVVHCNNNNSDENMNSAIVTTHLPSSFISSPSTTTTNAAATTTTAMTNNTICIQRLDSRNRSTNFSKLRRRRSRLDAQMIVLISINVAPFIIVHIITEIAYLFEKYSAFVAQSTVAKLLIVVVYLSWYLISATRFYTNCLLSRIYREEFLNRLRMLRHGCKPRIIIVGQTPPYRNSSRFYVASAANGVESTLSPIN